MLTTTAPFSCIVTAACVFFCQNNYQISKYVQNAKEKPIEYNANINAATSN